LSPASYHYSNALNCQTFVGEATFCTSDTADEKEDNTDEMIVGLANGL